MPKWIESFAMKFPTIHLLLIVISIGALFYLPPTLGILLLLGIVYLLPLILWRTCAVFYPLHEGISYLGVNESKGNPWIVAHRMQYLFITFSGFEKLLILIPGVFSTWLRLWGSQIGRQVMWTPRVDIVDRTHLQVGDYAFIGDHTYLATHFIKRKQGKLLLVVKGIKIESRALLGYGCVLGPGAVVPQNETLPAMTQALFGRINKVAEWK